ncbi:hypothetical protein [Saccharicrinis aurantiacus]|uniref:hypothetical protein n=1 Tax=Saccharicrinis aurantiacus TaxID=1849719 RepID=UPI0024914CB9|nr:hypothetical protein [Saccharicrinis aurantiacus]
MFFFGVLTSHITYIILVAVYICGYGSMVLNSDEGNALSLTDIEINVDAHSFEDSKAYTSQSFNCTQNKIVENKLLIKAKNTLFNKKQIPLISFTCSFFQVQHAEEITSRPPPFLV